MAEDFAKRIEADDAPKRSVVSAGMALIGEIFSRAAARARVYLRFLRRQLRRAASFFGAAGGDKALRRGSERIWSWRDPLGFSTIAGRIAALNVAALAILVGGVLYLSSFRAGLIDQKIESLTTEAQLIAITIAEAAGDHGEPGYDRIIANEVLRRMSLPTGLRAQIYDRSGRLTGDTRSLFPNAIQVEVAPIDNKSGGGGVLDRIEDLYARALALFSPTLEIYKETPPAGISRDREVYKALGGQVFSERRVNSENELILSVATPVKRVKTVMGALVLSTPGGDIDRIVRQERLAILQVFLVAFVASVLVSLALARTVAWPIRQLAVAAERGGGEDDEPLNPERIDIPDMTDRRDEIGHLSSAMRRMTSALYTRITAIESFAADVSHEIKNPLTSLRSAVESLRKAKTEEQRDALLGVIEHDVKRLDRLVTDISNASRLDAELVREERESFDVLLLLGRLVDFSKHQAEQHGVEVRLAECQHSAVIRGLEPRLAQVFHNLIDNALSFSEPGSTIEIRCADAPQERRPSLLITVQDEGSGIPPENLESIFQRFYSERPAGEEFGRHSGLGLSICRQIVEAHGGRIWAENRTDRSGARFCVLLPR